ncbi:hypothetical protein CEUSTIGMA_g5414.t1 [Chlamydomonas eustigma]|uniref:Uncharacterized protein n=1 Tax=Chlamydomonas eustigma TaxID=1157962 RepID=A0A250X508_9CHLO|nr:hypothetical protein CEUSTIGMA_g5414.t1 [Chlamydomonas eustigma]|eukprot:GAX77972.1 hypothetical protein CEUSTIGMA_g5414.t1 [Chlamydomonas eustigma]
MHVSPFQHFGDDRCLEADSSALSSSLRTLEPASSSLNNQLRRQILHGIMKGGRHRQKGALIADAYAASMRRDLHKAHTEELLMQNSLGHSPEGGPYFASSPLRTSSSSCHRKSLYQIQEALSSSIFSLHNAVDLIGSSRGEVTATTSREEVFPAASPVHRASRHHAQLLGRRTPQPLLGSPVHRALSAPSLSMSATSPHDNFLDVHGMMSGQLQLPKVLIPVLVTEQQRPQSRLASSELHNNSRKPSGNQQDLDDIGEPRPRSSRISPRPWGVEGVHTVNRTSRGSSISPARRPRDGSPSSNNRYAASTIVQVETAPPVWEVKVKNNPIRREDRFLNRTVTAACTAAMERDVQKLPPWPLTRSLLS